MSKWRPASQKQVIERHVAFAFPDEAREVVPVEPCQLDTERFIKPERLLGQEHQTQDSRNQHQRRKNQQLDWVPSWLSAVLNSCRVRCFCRLLHVLPIRLMWRAARPAV